MSVIKLKSGDGQLFTVDSKVIFCSKTIKTMFDDLGHDEGDSEEQIPLANVNGVILEKVIEWANYHQDDPPIPDDDDEEDRKYRRMEDIGDWDRNFLKIDQSTLFDLVLAANYLDIRGLLEVTCKSVANLIKGKTPEEIRAMFNLPDDLTEAEKEQIRKENEWCEEA